MYFANIIALIVGSLIAWVGCEAFTKITRLPRFGNFYTLLFPLILLVSPALAYIYLFPYRGALSGALPLNTILPSWGGIILYMLFFCALVLKKQAIKSRFLYCLLCFYISSFYFLWYLVDNIVHPIIG
ncbi:hypothetical protein JK232_18945 [Nissabacter archeti]|uniref:Uncharacterized protein n=1 Tax=Nissabacter archeti TaxID=1917880 RepID=A0ABS5JMF5_9GAMM|nr:hypothetical protein [Nissabacter archeti]MBS0970969.1 hypothetical protein [Nissabacter archeti]